MRVMDIALAALALRTLPARPPKAQRKLVPAVDEADAAMLDRAAISQQQAALVASLWPAPGQCVVRHLYAVLGGPAALGDVQRLTWLAPAQEDARARLRRLEAVFPAVVFPPPERAARAA